MSLLGYILWELKWNNQFYFILFCCGQTQLTTRKIEIKKLEEMHNPEMVKKMEMIKLIEDEELKMIFSYGFRNMFGNKLLTNFKLVLKKHIQDAKEHHKRIDWKKVLASFKGEAEHSMDIIELVSSLATFFFFLKNNLTEKGFRESQLGWDCNQPPTS